MGRITCEFVLWLRIACAFLLCWFLDCYLSIYAYLILIRNKCFCFVCNILTNLIQIFFPLCGNGMLLHKLSVRMNILIPTDAEY